jgi:hypothetical protein
VPIINPKIVPPHKNIPLNEISLNGTTIATNNKADKILVAYHCWQCLQVKILSKQVMYHYVGNNKAEDKNLLFSV